MLLKKLNSPLSKTMLIFEGAYNEMVFLAFFRICISFIALIDLASMLKDMPLLFAKGGTVIPQELMYFSSEYLDYLYTFYGYLARNHFEGIFYTNALIIYAVALLFLLSGLFSRASAIVALILQLLVFKSFPDFNYGYDNFLTMSLFYCAVFPVGKFYSIDRKLFNKRSTNVVFNYRRVIQFHLAIVYFCSGLSKLLDVEWWNGNAMWKAVASIYNNYAAAPPFIFLIGGAVVVLMELLYPLLVVKQSTRRIIIPLIILMHIGIAIAMELFSFAAIMAVWNIAAFTNLTASTATRNEKLA